MHGIKEMRARAKKLAKPEAWYAAQFVGHILQYSEKFKTRADRFARQIGFRGECVGLHVRQQDKIVETKLFGLKDYMGHVDAYYGRHPGKVKCIYLITDEADILREAKEK